MIKGSIIAPFLIFKKHTGKQLPDDLHVHMSTKEENKESNLTGFIIAFAGAIFFSTKAIIIKKAFADTHATPLGLLTLRMLFALPFYVAAAFFASSKKNNKTISKKQWVYICVIGILGYYLSSLFDFLGLQYVSAGLERLILFLYPTFAVLINAYWFGQPITKTQRIALILTYIGIGIAYYGELHIDKNNPNFLWGSLLIFICAVTYSFYLVGSGRLIPQVGVTKFTAYSMLTATVGILAHFTIVKEYQHTQFTDTVIVYGLMLAIIATVVPSFMLSYGMKKIGASNTAIITSIGPVSTILQAHFILKEPIFSEQLLGTLLVIAGVLLIGWKTRRTNFNT